MKRIHFTLPIALITVFLFFSGPLSAIERQTLKTRVEGMTCGMCETRVKKMLSPLCQEISIDREKGAVIFTFQSPVTREQVLTEANKTGFKFTPQN